MNYDKINGNVAFRESDHKYFDISDSKKQYVSVTTMIHSFSHPYDSEFWSKYKALESLLDPESWKIEKKSLLDTKKWNNELLDIYNIDELTFKSKVQDILDEWEMKNKESCERGSKIHSALEQSMYKQKKNINLQKFEIGGKFICDKNRTSLDLENGIYPEYLIDWDSTDGTFHIAGQIDLLVKKGNKIIIGDYKTNYELKTKGYFDPKTKSTTKMIYPLNTLDDVNMSHYNLQLSTYFWMLKKKYPEFELEDLVLIHFDHNDNMSVYHLDYLENEVNKMIAFYKKQQYLKMKQQSRQKIEY